MDCEDETLSGIMSANINIDDQVLSQVDVKKDSKLQLK
jgi:hypothetical protein